LVPDLVPDLEPDLAINFISETFHWLGA
jgi:hypothetical protein